MPVIVEPTVEGGMTFKEMQEEFYLRGFTDMEGESERVKRWLNQSYRELVDVAPWPFLEAQIEDKAPLTVERLGVVLAVDDITQERPLKPVDRRKLTEMWDPALTSESAPVWWYREQETTIAVWPKNTTDTIRVRFKVIPPRLVKDEDTPYVPLDYSDLIVDGAVVHAYRNRDSFAAAQELKNEWQLRVNAMIHALLTVNFDDDKTIERRGFGFEYL